MIQSCNGRLFFSICSCTLLFISECAPKDRKGSLKQRLERGGEELAASSSDVAPSSIAASSSDTVRGSLRRRLDRAAETTREPTRDQHRPLNINILRRWAKGTLSAADVQSIARDSVRQGTPGMEALARAGSEGMHPSNMQRDLLRFFGSPAGAPPLTYIPLSTTRGRVLHPVMLPHQLFSTLFEERRPFWEESVRGPLGRAREFWHHIRNSEIFQMHDALGPDANLDLSIPLGMHADGGSFSHQDSLFVISWNSLVSGSIGQGFARRLLFTLIRKSDLCESTFEDIWRVFSWSLNHLCTGISPSKDWRDMCIDGGERWLAEGYRGLLVQIRGDWEFLAQVIRLPAHNNNDNNCWLCRASRIHPGLLWHDFSRGAGWRRTIRTHRSWEGELRSRGSMIPLIFQLVIGLTLSCVAIDVLHVLDLGVAAHVLGNLFWLIIKRRRGGTQESRAKTLSSEIESWHSDRNQTSGLRGPLTVKRLRNENSKYPKLKAKGASVRSLIPCALDMARANDLGEREIAVVQLLNEFYNIIYDQDLFLEDWAVQRIGEIGFMFCNMFTDLSRSAHDNNEQLWKSTPKLHLFAHLCELQVMTLKLNPRSFWCYADEDLVGQLIEIASSSHPMTLAEVGMLKWLLLTLGCVE